MHIYVYTCTCFTMGYNLKQMLMLIGNSFLYSKIWLMFILVTTKHEVSKLKFPQSENKICILRLYELMPQNIRPADQTLTFSFVHLMYRPLPRCHLHPWNLHGSRRSGTLWLWTGIHGPVLRNRFEEILFMFLLFCRMENLHMFVYICQEYQVQNTGLLTLMD